MSRFNLREKRERQARQRLAQGKATKSDLRLLAKIERQDKLRQSEAERIEAFEYSITKEKA